MWGMTAMKKGTAMKDKKKRSSPPPRREPILKAHHLGYWVMSHELESGRRSVARERYTLREAASPPGTFLQLTDAGGTPNVKYDRFGKITFTLRFNLKHR